MKNERRLAIPAALLAVAVATGCADDLPTAGGADRFPGGQAPVTVEILLTGAELFSTAAVYDGFADPLEAPYGLVAEDFDGDLDAHTLARFRDLPASVTYNADGVSRTDSTYELVSAELRTVVDSTASEGPSGSATLQVWELLEPWDSSTVSWENAAEGDPWTVPGGTPGELLSEAVWVRADTLLRDTVVWQLNADAIERLASEDANGVVITSATPGSRLQIGAVRLRVTVRPESTPDTTVTVDVVSGARNFVFTPAPPAPAGVLRVGGITGARTNLEVDLPEAVPSCQPAGPLPLPGGDPNCPPVSLREVTINLAELVLDPLTVPSGFRPAGTPQLQIRRILEPELGRLAPLGQALVADTVSAQWFADGEAGGPARMNLTNAVRAALQTSEEGEFALSLLGGSGNGNFGYQWYAADPVLRIVYTLPITPSLP